MEEQNGHEILKRKIAVAISRFEENVINAIKTKSNCPRTYVCLTFDYRCHNYNIFQDKIFAWIPRQMLCLDARYIHT